MSQLIRLFVRSRNFLLFVVLEVFCFWLIVSYNNHWDATFFNTSNYAVAKTLEKNNQFQSYLNLREVNESLIAENRRLQTSLSQLQQYSADKEGTLLNAGVAARYQYKIAKVINNTVGLANNFITIDKGTLDGIEVGMGVISSTGVVGKVKSCGDNYAVVYSILHSKFDVSAKIKQKTPLIGTAKWDGTNPQNIDLLYIDRYKAIKKGDSVLTSDYNVVFPPDILIGRIKQLTTRPDQPFYDLDVALSTDFRNLQYVYIISNTLKKEQETLEKTAQEQQ